MSLAELDRQRHAEERGQILQALAKQYGSLPVSVRALRSALNLVGYPMSLDDMQFHLVYLTDSGYLTVTRVSDGFRTDRDYPANGALIVTAKLTVKGLHLVDAVIPADPLVIF